ncbi:nucleoside recognition domain-containing protein [Paenibacillus sinopodophylli]|uniref:nucleoside recognition domain-containing protein n=1 Tax=Paenibacillus sinopodophylli TaxID=1837342 RepID=UPI00110D19D6|nr:nucleoside recognition domain-containing protein [Paenibacillus sinopodophylli]
MAKTVMLAFLSILLVSTIILQPDASFQSSLQGLTVWWNIVFPGLLPFLILFELISAFGLAHAVSSLTQPVMNRLFKLPGEASHAVILGWMGGYPSGAEATASLRKRKLVTKQQGQRLLALAHMPNPLFMLVVIGAGFLHKPIVGVMIACTVWLSALCIMFAMTLLQRREQEGIELADKQDKSVIQKQKNDADTQGGSLLLRAAEAFRLGREQDGRSFGKALGDSVAASVQKLMMIGGFMIFAAVLAKLTEPLLTPLLAKTGLTFISQAFFEGHLGAYSAAVWQHQGAGTIVNAAAIAAVLAWSGLSGILQAGYSISGTDLKLLPFVAWRAAHALLAALFMLLLWKPMISVLGMLLDPSAVPSFAPANIFTPDQAIAVALKASDLPRLWPFSMLSCLLVALTVLILSTILLPYSKTNRSA